MKLTLLNGINVLNYPERQILYDKKLIKNPEYSIVEAIHRKMIHYAYHFVRVVSISKQKKHILGRSFNL